MKAIDYLKMFTVISTIIILVSCQNNEVYTEQLTTPTLKSAGMAGNTCTPQSYGLLVKQQIRIGEMIVSNSDDYLMIEVIPDQNTCINNINLWIGGSLKKVNLKGDDSSSPTRSGGYSISSSDSYFAIPLDAIYSKDQDIACEAKELYIIAHITATVATPAGTEEVSAWSEGTAIGNSQNATYSAYTTCCRSTGGGGCFPYKAWGGTGNAGMGVFYYDNTTGGKQLIIAENGEISNSYIEYENNTLTIFLPDNWKRDEVKYPVKIQGYNSVPTDEPLQYDTYEGDLLSVPVDYFPYYLIHLDLANCHTGNP